VALHHNFQALKQSTSIESEASEHSTTGELIGMNRLKAVTNPVELPSLGWTLWLDSALVGLVPLEKMVWPFSRSLAISLVHISTSPDMTKNLSYSNNNRQIVVEKEKDVKSALEIFEAFGWMIFWVWDGRKVRFI
jgi:hypothetical protein